MTTPADTGACGAWIAHEGACALPSGHDGPHDDLGKPSGASVLGHGPSIVIYDGETWRIVCACDWECWNLEDEEEAWAEFNDHIFDDVKATIARMRERVVF